MRRSQALLGAVVAAALTGCGGAPPPVPYATTPFPPLPVLDSTRVGTLTGLPWTLVSIDDSGRLLTVETAEDCHDVDGVTIANSATTVTLSLLGTSTGTCTTSTATRVYAVRLPEPVGTRALLQ